MYNLPIKVLVFSLVSLFLLTHSSCIKDDKIDRQKYGNCTDRIQNQNELGIDCGGVCTPCSSCSDGIKNQGETGIDCGGPCPSCAPSCSLALGVTDFTLYPNNSTPYYGNDNGIAYSVLSQSQIEVDFSGPTLVGMTLQFMDNVNPLASLSLNQSMAFTAVGSTFDLQKSSQVLINYTYDNGGSGMYGIIDAGQRIYITKLSNSTGTIQFCNITGGSTTYGKDGFSMNATLN